MATSSREKKSREKLSRSQARRVVLAAQGFGAARPDRPVGMRDVQATINRLGQFQIDSINVVTRAHFMPLFSRLGAYDPSLLERAAHKAPRRVFEYWGHAASLIDVNLQPALRYRMAVASERDMWPGIARIEHEQPDLIDWVRDQIAERGPISARELEPTGKRKRDSWGWNWSSVKTACEWLFYTGEITAAKRNSQFERLYDLPDQVLPTAVMAQEMLPPAAAIRALVRRAAQALGVANEYCLRDYFRTRPDSTRIAIAELVDNGELIPVKVEGWEARPTYLWHEAKVPRRVQAQALVSPFDSVMFERARLEALFDFFYRIEIYVPAAKRIHGYYVYPFIYGERFVARVDLKADRAVGVLRVNGAWAEPIAGSSPGEITGALADELTVMAGWLGLERVEVSPRGDLAARLAAALRSAVPVG